MCPSFPIPISRIGSPILRMPRRCRDTDSRSISIRRRGPAGHSTPITEADRSAEVALRAAISATHPDHAILGEEYGETGSGSCRWVLDPVDGTRPFISGIPVWSTLIGFTVEGRARMGMMSQPFTGERFWATPDGAWGERARNRYPLRTREVSDLSQAILHTTSREHYDGALKHGLDRLTAAVRMIRFGGESYAVAMLAAGHIDLCLEPTRCSLNFWTYLSSIGSSVFVAIASSSRQR